MLTYINIVELVSGGTGAAGNVLLDVITINVPTNLQQSLLIESESLTNEAIIRTKNKLEHFLDIL